MGPDRDDPTPHDLPFVDRALPAGMHRTHLALLPGERRPSAPGAWEGALLVIESGTATIECRAGGRRSFTAGSILALTGIDVVAIRNDGLEPLLAVSITRTGESEPPDR